MELLLKKSPTGRDKKENKRIKNKPK